MKVLNNLFTAIILGSIVGCISTEKSNNETRRVLDGYYDSSLVSKSSEYENWNFYKEVDSLFIVRTKCNQVEDELTITTMIVIEVDSEATNMGTKDRRILEIVTNRTNGEVLRVNSREGRYRSNLHHYQDRFNYRIKLDSCKVSGSHFGLYDWE